MNKKFIIIIIAAFSLILLVVTCPSKQDHQDEIKTVLSNVIDDKISESMTESEQGWAIIGSLFAGKIIEVFVEQKLKVNNYLLFSTGEVHMQGKTKTISFGILNHVFTYDEEDLKEAIRESN